MPTALVTYQIVFTGWRDRAEKYTHDPARPWVVVRQDGRKKSVIGRYVRKEGARQKVRAIMALSRAVRECHDAA